MDSRLALMTGIPIPIPECQIAVHQPTLEEISYMGEEDFFIGVQTLTLHKSMFVKEGGKDVLDSISNFQIFMMVMSERKRLIRNIAQCNYYQSFFQVINQC